MLTLRERRGGGRERTFVDDHDVLFDADAKHALRGHLGRDRRRCRRSGEKKVLIV